MNEFLLIFSAIATMLCLIFWRLLMAQENKLKSSEFQSRRKLNELLLQTKAERRELKLLLNAFDDSLIIIDKNYKIHVANQAAKTLSEGRKLRDNTVQNAFKNEVFVNAICSATESTAPQRQTIVLPADPTKPDSNETAWIIDTAPLRTHDEDPLHRVIIRDVTPEHRTDQVKREFVANASHELRTPLAIINGYLENLLEDNVIESPATARRFLTTMSKHGDRLSRLIDDMLTVSKLESGESAQLDIEPFPLKEIIDDITDRLSALTLNKGTEILYHANGEIILTGDRFYWDQVLFNLIENALKQNPEKPITVTVKAESDETKTTISIIDNGKGIPSEHLPFIFNRFYRVQKHHSQNTIKGTGLGLSIVKHAIEAHGGSISVNSVVDQETTFTINVPHS